MITQKEIFGRWPDVDDKTKRAIRDRLIEAGNLEAMRNPDAHNRIEFNEDQASVLIGAIGKHIGTGTDEPRAGGEGAGEESSDGQPRETPEQDTEEERTESVAKGARQRRTDSPNGRESDTRSGLLQGAGNLRSLLRQPGIEADRQPTPQKKQTGRREGTPMSFLKSDLFWILLLVVVAGLVLWLILRPRPPDTRARTGEDPRRGDLRQRAAGRGISLDNPPAQIMRDVDAMIEGLP